MEILLTDVILFILLINAKVNVVVKQESYVAKIIVILVKLRDAKETVQLRNAKRIVLLETAKETVQKKCRNICHNKWPHRTHDKGTCVDILPMKKGRFSIHGTTTKMRSYDAEMTKKFLQLAKEKGADTIYFSDAEALGKTKGNIRYRAGHTKHAHICFNPGPKTRKTCMNFIPDKNICPMLAGKKEEK